MADDFYFYKFPHVEEAQKKETFVPSQLNDCDMNARLIKLQVIERGKVRIHQSFQ